MSTYRVAYADLGSGAEVVIELEGILAGKARRLADAGEFNELKDWVTGPEQPGKVISRVKADVFIDSMD